MQMLLGVARAGSALFQPAFGLGRELWTFDSDGQLVDLSVNSIGTC